MRLLTERAEFLVECLDLPEAAQVDGAVWERFQIAHMNDDGLMRIEDKSRQIAWSFTVAAEAVACAILDAESTVFVSINKDEASEKVRYAKRVYENLEVSDLPPIIADNVMGLEFANGARIMSLPSRPPRGKAKMHVVLDEFAHVMRDRQIYKAAMPIITRGGRLRIGSSPMGAGGTHWEVSQQALQSYAGFTRVTTPWWAVASFCDSLPGGAEGMETAERVKRFGNGRIQALFSNMLLDDFQQEYECLYVDEVVSYFSWELIRRNQDDTLLFYKTNDVGDIERIVQEMKGQIAAGAIEPVLVGGVDIGRKKHLTEIILLGIGAGNKSPVRLMVSLDRIEFDAQERLLRHILTVLPVSTMLIDQNGIGMHLAENLAFDTVAEGVTFTNASKQLWASGFKIQMERGTVPIPADRDLGYQIHSVKKKVTAAKNSVFDTEKNEKHHADKFWALALASSVVQDAEGSEMEMVSMNWSR